MVKNCQKWSKMGQFCTTSPNISFVGILLGWLFKTPKSLGWIPTVSIPNPDQPPLRIYLELPYFCTKKKTLGTHDGNYPKIHPNRIPTTIYIST